MFKLTYDLHDHNLWSRDSLKVDFDWGFSTLNFFLIGYEEIACQIVCSFTPRVLHTAHEDPI